MRMQQCALPPKLDMGKPTAGDCNRTHWEKASWNVAPWSLRFLAAEVKPAQKAASLGWRRDAAAFRSLCDFSNGYFVRAPGNWSCIPRPTAALRLWEDGIRLLTIEEGLKYQDRVRVYVPRWQKTLKLTGKANSAACACNGSKTSNNTLCSYTRRSSGLGSLKLCLSPGLYSER